MKGKAQTVCGLVDPGSLGRTLTHEHLTMDFQFMFTPAAPEDKQLENCPFTLPNISWIHQNPFSHKPNLRMDVPDVMAAVMDEMGEFKKLGGSTIVENTSFGIKRNVNFMSEICRKHGINIVAGAGYYVMNSQAKDTLGMSVERMVENMTVELTVGCHDAPNIRCGFIGEVGCTWPLYDFERRTIQATGETQANLGCPVLFHPGRHHDAPEEIFRIYTEAGGHPSKMVMAHLDRTFHELDALVEFASLGTYCEYDLFGIETSHYQLNTSIDMPSDAQRIARIRHLVESGFGKKVVISHDIYSPHRLTAYGGHGYTHILKNIVPKMLDRGLNQGDVDKILITNPATWLTFTK